MTDGLTLAQRNGLIKLSEAMDAFEPLDARPGLGEKVIQDLIYYGLAEVGDCSAKFAGRGYKIGYRVTKEGWEALGAKSSP